MISKCHFEGQAPVASGPEFLELPPREGYARLYFIILDWRESMVGSPHEGPDIKIDGRLIGVLPVGSYLACYAPVGTHTIEGDFDRVSHSDNEMKRWRDKRTIAIQPDESHFYLFIFAGAYSVGSPWHFDDLGNKSNGLVVGLEPNNSNYDLLIK